MGISVYAKHRYSATVITNMLKMVKEFRQCSVSADMLREASAKLDESFLKSKVDELSLVMDAYTSVVENSYFDDAAFLGDSRTEGFWLYSGVKTGRLLATGNMRWFSSAFPLMKCRPELYFQMQKRQR